MRTRRNLAPGLTYGLGLQRATPPTTAILRGMIDRDVAFGLPPASGAVAVAGISAAIASSAPCGD